MAKNQTQGLRRAFFAGIATLLPTVLTIFILVVCFNFLDEKIAQPITTFIRAQLSSEFAKEHYWTGVLNYQPWQLDEVVSTDPLHGGDIAFEDQVKAHVPSWLGFFLGLILVLAVGIIFKGYLGRQLLRLLESWIQRIPLIKVIYPYAKQVTEFFFKEKKKIEYQTAVAVEYPRKGLWSIGFITSEGFRDVSDAAGTTVVSIFIPSSPTPITGYTILVPRDKTIPLDLTVDEALRFTISAGVILPEQQQPRDAIEASEE